MQNQRLRLTLHRSWPLHPRTPNAGGRATPPQYLAYAFRALPCKYLNFCFQEQSLSQEIPKYPHVPRILLPFRKGQPRKCSMPTTKMYAKKKKERERDRELVFSPKYLQFPSTEGKVLPVNAQLLVTSCSHRQSPTATACTCPSTRVAGGVSIVVNVGCGHSGRRWPREGSKERRV